MIKNLKILLAGIVLLSVNGQSMAEIVMTGLTHNENFNSLPTATVASVFSATVGAQSAIVLTGWDGTKIGGTGTSATSFVADTGAGTSGSIYSYGNAPGTPPVPSTERALGMVASGTNIMGFGFKVRNNSGATFSDLTIAFTQENWRSSTSTLNTMAASYATSSLGALDGNFLSSGLTFTSATALNLVGPTPVATNGALDGNNAANQVARTLTLTGINLVQGDWLYFRWQDVNEAGNDAGLAIDDFSIRATAVPEPTTIAMFGLVMTGLVTRRRR